MTQGEIEQHDEAEQILVKWSRAKQREDANWQAAEQEASGPRSVLATEDWATCPASRLCHTFAKLETCTTS